MCPESVLSAGHGLIGLMTPIRGRAARYCRRIESVRDLANLVITKDAFSKDFKGERDYIFGATVYYLRRALRELAFASAVQSSENLEARSRYYTTHCHGSFILNSMEFSNPGAYPWPLTLSSINNSKLSLASYVAELEYRPNSCLTPEYFIWAWRVCNYSINCLNVGAAWRGLSEAIRPANVAEALLELLQCHMVSLYRRGVAWIVICPPASGRAAVIPVFDRGADRIRCPYSRYKEYGKIMHRYRYRESRDWPSLPPEIVPCKES